MTQVSLTLDDAPTESAILRDVLLAVSVLPATMCWRNNTGRLPDRTGRWVSFGLIGSGDVIGCRAIVVTPDMVGRTIGQAFSIETKRPKGGVFREQQARFAAAWRAAGGLYVPAKTAQEALDGLAAG